MKKIRQDSQLDYSLLPWQETPHGIRFVLPSFENMPISIESYFERIPTSSYESQAQLILLKELLDNGMATSDAETIIVPCEEICNLVTRNERHLLGLPEPYPFDIEIRSYGTFNQPDFKYIYRYLTPDSKEMYPARVGCVLRLTVQRAYLLTSDQFHLLESLDEFNSRHQESKKYSSNLLEFAKIKTLASKTGALLDSYLNNEEVINPSSIRLRLRKDGDLFEILPEIPTADNSQFEKSFDRYPTVENVYDLQRPDGGRTHIVFHEKQKEALNTIKKHRRLSRDQLAKIAEEPQAYFDPDVVDIDQSGESLSFSERVREIGIYHPRVYPFISPYKSQWIPGVMVEYQTGERINLKIHSFEELNDLKQQLIVAKEKGKSYIIRGDQQIPIQDIEMRIPFFERQLSKPKEPVVDSGEIDNPVLIIEENIDGLGYVKVHRESKEELKPPSQDTTIRLKGNAELLPHQLEGFLWLRELYSKGYSGALLADDMGVGKTLQVLYFLEWHCSNRSKHYPYLIVAPLALIENWSSEYQKFFSSGNLNIDILHGARLNDFKVPPDSNPALQKIAEVKQIPEMRSKRGSLDINKLLEADVIITTYETIREFQMDFGLIPWGVIVIDEAQRIKTPGTLVTNALKAMKSEFRIACTGTPIENSLVDLWCITDFIAPGYLGSAKEFAKEFQTPLKEENTDIIELGERVRKKIGILLKRRMKNDILKELPEKFIHICQEQMPEEQLNYYKGILQTINNPGLTGVSYRNMILRIIYELRDICDHPLLLNSQCNLFPADKLISQSAKLKATISILDHIRQSNEKAILFTDRRKTQHLLELVIRKAFGLNDIHIINGNIPGTIQGINSTKLTRQQKIDQFQDKKGFNVIIMSPLAAGLGLNITEANHVIHYSRWWNPAKEDQASDRVYRIGQKRLVHIYLPMSVSKQFKTFDVILNDLLERKRQLSQGALFPTERMEVTPDDLISIIQKESPEKQSQFPLGIDDIENFEPASFEAFIAALYKKQNYSIKLTQLSGDKGVDVIVFPVNKKQHGLLIQVKHTTSGRKIGKDAIAEIVAAKPFYEQQLDISFQPVVITNHDFTKEAYQLANANGVRLYEHKWLANTINKIEITINDINHCELMRGL